MNRSTPIGVQEAIVFLNGDDVFEDLFTAGTVLQRLATDAGFATRQRYGFQRLLALPDEVARASCFILYTARGTFTPEQQAALADLVAHGRGLVVIHSSNVFGSIDGALDPVDAAAFTLIGSRYASHGPEPRWSDVTVRLDDEHPVTAGVTEFTTYLEHYRIEQADEANLVLAHRDAPYGAEPLVYVREHGRGRVVYVQLGHDMRTLGEPAFERIVRQAVAWSAEPAASTAAISR